MDIDEKLFHFAWRMKRKFHKVKLSENVCELSEVKLKLASIACAFFGRMIHIKETHGDGGLVGDSLFLPTCIDKYDDYQKNYSVYLYRVISDCYASKYSYILKNNILAPYDFRFLGLLKNSIVNKAICRNYPNLEEILSYELFDTSKSNNFFYVWQMSILDEKNLDRSRLKKEERELIKEMISLHLLSAEELISCSLKYVEKLRLLGVDKKKKYEYLSFFSNAPTTAQILTLKNQGDSSIQSVSSEEEKTVKHSKSKERVKYIELDEKDPDCNPANLLMEGIQTADIFSGGQKMLDGSDEMDDHFSALEDLEMQEMTRSSVQTQSVFKADISVHIEFDENHFAEKEIGNFHYDEWSYKSKRYKKNWCSLVQNKLDLPEKRDAFDLRLKELKEDNNAQIQSLKHYLDRILAQRRPHNRQSSGPEIDIDALINCKADILSGHSPHDNLYISKRKKRSEVSVLILLDSSLSSDSWIEGKRVIDIARDSILMIQEVLDKRFQNIMVSSFYSNTRKNCVYNIVKDFSDSWPVAMPRLENVKPSGYTRIGVALRHSFYLLDKTKTKKKIVLLISDGKPTDYDAYEGRLGICDVRQSVREANAKDIKVFSLAIDKEAKFYFPQLFGANNFEVLSSIKKLPEQMIKIFSKII